MKARGFGIGSIIYGLGYGFNRPDFGAAEVDIADDGTVTIWSGASELGQGLRTILCQIAAQELTVPYEDVRIVSADTAVTPDSGGVSASRSTYNQGNALILACRDLKQQMAQLAGDILNVEAEGLEFHRGEVRATDGSDKSISVRRLAAEMHGRARRFRGHGWVNIASADVDPDTSQGNAFAAYSWATQLAKVEVDTETGQVQVLRIVSATDAGKAINPMLVEGQIEGGAAQGLGFALMENMIVQDGVLKNPSFSTYLIPTAADVPPITALIVEVPEATGPYGAKGVGEPATIPTGPAIFNAIADAIGVRVNQTPASAERILQLLGLIPGPAKEAISPDDIPYPPF